MNFFRKLFASTPKNNDKFYPLKVRCLRCGEILEGQVNMGSELSVEYGENDNSNSFFVRKVLMGKGRCFQQVEVELTFDANRNLQDKKILGGKFVEDSDGA